jgi:membrane protease YdiL (CAAX protease family)
MAMSGMDSEGGKSEVDEIFRAPGEGSLPEPPAIPAEEIPPWGPWWAIFWTFVVFCVWAVAQFALMAVMKAGVAVSGDGRMSESEDFAETIMGDGDLMGAIAFGAAVVGVFMILAVVKTRGTTLARGMAFRLPKVWVWPIVLVGTPFLLMLLGLAVTPFQGESSVADQGKIAMAIRETDWLPILLLGVALGAPLFEEFLFRGLLHEGLKQSFLGRWGSMVLTAALFSIIHSQYQDPSAFLLLFLLGCSFTIGRELSGSIFVPVLMHSIQNALATIPLWLVLNGFVPMDQLPEEMREVIEYSEESTETMEPVLE